MLWPLIPGHFLEVFLVVMVAGFTFMMELSIFLIPPFLEMMPLLPTPGILLLEQMIVFTLVMVVAFQFLMLWSLFRTQQFQEMMPLLPEVLLLKMVLFTTVMVVPSSTTLGILITIVIT